MTPEFFLIQKMILNDGDFDNAVKDIILRERLNADFAVVQTTRNYSKLLGKIDSEYIKSRSADLKDICDRLLKHILNLTGNGFNMTEKAIVCAEDLVPSEMMNLDMENVLAVCKIRFCEFAHPGYSCKNHECYRSYWNRL